MNEFEKQMMRRANTIINAQPELKEQSNAREKYKFQKELPFDGAAALSSEDIERRPCTKEERERLDESLEKLGDLFSDADFFWQLDGALNISLYRGEYIGVHKDIDISIDSRELEKVEAYLQEKGCGFFLGVWKGSGKGMEFERVDWKKFRDSKGVQRLIMAIDDKGAIRYDDRFSVDTHLIQWNGKGEPVGNNDTQIPMEWLDPTTVNFHGKSIRCSHPALAAFYKLFFVRAYDDNDLRLLAESGKLTASDIDLLEQTFEMHAKDVEKIIDEFAERVMPNIQNEQDADNICEILIADKMVRGQNNPQTRKFFLDLAREILKNADRSRERIRDIVFSFAPFSKLVLQKDSKLSILRNNIPGI